MPKPKTKSLTANNTFGVSFSIKQCRSFGVDSRKCLKWLVNDCGFKQFRLMSYWNEHEKSPGSYDFSELDWQIDMIEKAGGSISLCLGARQPRWPENHWPDWAWKSPKQHRDQSLLNYLETVVKRYKSRPSITSYQLENEALLSDFGERSEVDKDRLRSEFKLVKKLDPLTPAIMTTSTSWGIPIRQPIPDMVGFSYYQVHFSSKKQKYSTSFHTPLLHKTRSWLIKLIHGKKSFIHELQLEPWGPANIWEMSSAEQDKSMSPDQIHKNLKLALKTNLTPIYLWGGEWWYWRYFAKKDQSIWQAVEDTVRR